MEQKKLKDKYMEIICDEVWPKSPSMQKYAYEQYGYGVELDDGDIAVIEKPSLKKDFCFGYGYCGVATEEDMYRASDMVKHASSDQSYFIKKNMEQLDDILESLIDPRYSIYKGVSYINQADDSKLKSIYFYRDSEDAERKGLVKLSKKEVDAMIQGYKEMKAIFMKRLERYLKRYGLSKVNAWSYLSD